MLVKNVLREWLSGGALPCQGRGRGFESRLALWGGSWDVWFPSFRDLLFYVISQHNEGCAAFRVLSAE